jgi:hypothetical protein
VQEDHPLVPVCRRAGYPIEPDRYSDRTAVISFPVGVPHCGRRKAEVPVREKIDLAAQMQYHWSDNQVSCTAEFDPQREAGRLPQLLAEYEKRLKAIVFLPGSQHGYDQPPYEEVSREQYKSMRAQLKPLEGELPHEHELEARYCEGGVCDYSPP